MRTEQNKTRYILFKKDKNHSIFIFYFIFFCKLNAVVKVKILFG